jgi:hypothetical protein
MVRVSFFSRGALRSLVVRAVTAIALCGFAAASYAAYALAISGSPSTIAVTGQAYYYKPTVSNPSGKALTFTIVNRPAWASFNASTGALAGTPPSTAAGTGDADIVIRVTNGTANASVVWSIRVWPGSGSSPDKPVISGSPATAATVGKTYAFQPTARDPAGKTLSFSVHNKPSWASFSIASGLLDGTPSSSQTGTYGNIIITASNGTYATSLPAFNIAVSAAGAPPPAGSAQLTWVPPTQNTNGSALTDLAGIRIYYGTSQSSLSKSVEVAGNGATTYTISGLPAGKWYFGAEAYTTTGTTSAMSGVVSKTIQ